jgi:hypothetical protein
MDDHIIEIDQIEDGHVVLVVPSLRLIVIGPTLEEARAWARSTIWCRGLPTGQRADLATGTDDVTGSQTSNAA